MTNIEAIEVIKTEKKCVLRNMRGCNRDCGKCDLVLPEEDILLAYDMAIKWLRRFNDVAPEAIVYTKMVDARHVSSLDEEDDRK